jgi:hypothetical protein
MPGRPGQPPDFRREAAGRGLKWGDLKDWHSSLLRQIREAEKGREAVRLAYLCGQRDALEHCFPQSLGGRFALAEPV